MKKNLTLSVPRPCAEDWNSFAPTATGGFCGQCSKNVVDFTKASDEEVLEFIKTKPTHACGRFRANQLKQYPTVSPVLKPGFTLLRAGIIGILLLLISKPTSAQTAFAKPKTEVSHKSNKSVVFKTEEHRITGVVTSSEDGSPLPGVSVVQQGTASGTQTDGDGRFELILDLQRGKILVISFIGLKNTYFTIENPATEIKITMIPDETILGEIVMMGEVSIHEPYSEEQSFFRRTWGKFKGMFVGGNKR